MNPESEDGGITRIAVITGLDRKTIRKGEKESDGTNHTQDCSQAVACNE